jgi:hypothetical protein
VQQLLVDFLASTAGLATKGMLVICFVDLIFGVFAALKDGTFAMDELAAFGRKHILGRVFPAATLLFVGYLTNDLAMSAAGGALAAAYTAETASSVYGSISPPAPSVKAEANPAEIINPVPTD